MAIEGCIPKAGEALDPGVLAACIQAAAAQDAAFWQALAAWGAGALTLLAGGAAVWAAVRGTAAARKGIIEQITAQQTLQITDQHFTAKRDVYLNTITGLYAGMMAISRFADPRLPYDAALSEYTTHGPMIAQVHVVAPIEVINPVLDVMMALAEAHANLIKYRIANDNPQNSFAYTPYMTQELGSLCITLIGDLVSPFVAATIAMRADIGMDIDKAQYEKMLLDVMSVSVAEAHEVLKSIGQHRAQ
jgi:hypothetical protein